MGIVGKADVEIWNLRGVVSTIVSHSWSLLYDAVSDQLMRTQTKNYSCG